MEPRLAVRAALAVLSASVAFVAAPSAQEPAEPPANYVVHEWGTFTSMAGTDGFVLEGLHHEEEHLPKFVHDLARIAAFAPADGEKLPASRVTQKMETPVIYFYADEPMQAQVRVWFQHGVMTQFYPLPHTVTPELSVLQKARLDVSGIDFSSLVWDVDVIPRTRPHRPASRRWPPTIRGTSRGRRRRAGCARGSPPTRRRSRRPSTTCSTAGSAAGSRT